MQVDDVVDVGTVSAALEPWSARIDDSERAVALDYARSLHPHAQKLIFRDLTGAGSSGCGVRLTLKDELVGADLRVGSHASITFNVDWIDLFVLPSRVGAIVVRLSWSEASDVGVLAAAIHQVRKIDFAGRLMSQIEPLTINITPAGEARESSWRYELRRISEQLPFEWSQDRGDGASGLLAHEALLQPSWHVAVAATVEDDETGEDTPIDRWAYQLATGFSGSGAWNEPSAKWMEQIGWERQLAFFNNWRMLSLHENLVQVAWVGATTGGSSLREYAMMLQNNFQYQHLSLFLLALLQRRRLDAFMSEVVGLEGTVVDKAEQFTELSTAFNLFATRLYNVTATNTPVGEPLYALLRRNLRVDPVFRSVEEDLARVGQQLAVLSAEREAVSARRTSRFLAFIAIITTPLALMFTVFADSYHEALVFGRWSRADKLLLLAGVLFVEVLVFAWLFRDGKEGSVRRSA